MNTTIIIVLALILLFLIILNHVSITLSSNNTQQSNVKQGKCSQTAYGCCPDGVNSKIDFNGTNCPRYNPGPGYKI